MPHLDKKSI